MKHKLFTISLSILALILSLFVLPGCSEIRGENKQEVTSLPETNAIPHMIPRPEGLGSVAERAQVAQLYDDQVSILKQQPGNAKAWLTLAEIFMNEARVTGEHPYYYPKALEMIASVPPTAMAANEDLRFNAHFLEASVLMSLHEFEKAAQKAKAALAIYPHNAGIHGVLIDAHVELGQYNKAVEYSDIMVSLRPDLRSYSRISYLREIHGDPKGSIEAMKMAVGAGMPGYEQSAWCRYTLGQIHERYGELAEAEMHYQITLQERPDYPFAVAALAGIEIKKGRLDSADKLLNQAIGMIPEVGFFVLQAELRRMQGNEKAAEKLVPEILAMMEEDAAAGHNMDLELAQVHLHLAGNIEQALAYSKKAQAIRPENIDVCKMLADVYLHQGALDLAQGQIELAMRTGSQNPEIMLLAGLIQLEAGESTEGLALVRSSLEQNPYLKHPRLAEVKRML